MKNIVLLEFGDSHTEIIHSVVSLLAQDYRVHLVINERSVDKISNQTPVFKIYPLRVEHRIVDAIRFQKEIQPNLIILNSAQGRIIRDYCLRSLLSSIPIIGFHHNPASLYASFTQKIINFKVHKYIVLADFIVEHLVEKGVERKKLFALYPTFYPNMQSSALVKPAMNVVSIPGVLEQDRRDYYGLIDICVEKRDEIPADMKFILLGNSNSHDGPEIKKRVVAHGLESFFEFYDSYVSDQVVFESLRKSRYVMPLLHPGTKWFSMYFETKISGAYNLAYAFRKPLLMHEVFSSQKEFYYSSQFYEDTNLFSQLKKETPKIPEEFYHKFEFETQKQALLKFISEF